MPLRCARSECGIPATVSLLFKADLAEVHLIDLADATAGIPLCPRHARTRTAPVGWSILDLRSPAHADDAVAEEPVEIQGPADRPPLRREAEPDEEVEAVAFPYGRSSEPAEVAQDLQADSPLLSRAFRSVNG